MIVQTWVEVLQNSFAQMLNSTVGFIPNFLGAIIIFIIGWFIGALLGRIVAQAVRAIKVDQALRSAGIDDVVRRAGYDLDAGAFLGALVKWFVIIVFLMFALTVLGLTAVTLFLNQIVVSFLPAVIVAVLILLVAAVIAEVAQGVIVGAARAAGIRSAGFAGAVTKWAIWGFAIIVALSQLGIATAYFQTLFTGLVVAVSLAFGLAFGLGGQEAAARAIEKTREQMNNR
jgi:hypothetical protein